jgi:hypothetical protein
LFAGQDVAPPGGFEPIDDGLVKGTGSAELRPAPPSSVDPRGIPARPADEVDGGSETLASACGLHGNDETPGKPPPSKTAPEDGALALEQLPVANAAPVPVGGAAGLTPGVASSIDPSGIPTRGTAVSGPGFSGELPPKPDDGCALGIID